MAQPPAGPVRPGDAYARTVTLTAEEIGHFATLSGDTNPLHHDEALARATSFGGRIASGGHLVALCMGALAGQITRATPSVGIDFSFQLRRAARAGDTLSIRWEVMGVAPSERLRGDLVTVALEARNQAGEVVVTGRGLVLAREAF
jgi:acyl dehydratase